MNELDVYYRALLEYRKLTTAQRSSAAVAEAFAEADTEKDKIVVTRARCTIDRDWVEAIEQGLVHIEKAIKEERQFIQSNGEVIPIEKVKHVSTESVKHLAKHSNLISRVPEDENNIIPDKLYTVERLSDYAVYENRFLYMLLCYLRDFVTIRYNKIVDLTNKYNGALDMQKTVSIPKRTISYTVSLKEERRDDAYLREHNEQRDIIDRMDLILKAVLAFLSTPLMEDCAKVAMIKPPITKTNVLKMNNNFKGAVALYDFIVAYDKPGYTVENIVNELAPFRSDVADEIAEAGAMLSFLTYEHGLDIKDELKAAYEREEQRRKNEALIKKSEEILALGRRVKKMEIPLEEYALMLEKQVKALTAECEKIEPLRKEIKELKETEARLNERIEELMAEVDALNAELIAQAKRHEEEIRRLNEEHAAEIAELNRAHEEEINRLTEEYEEKIRSLTEKYENEIAELKENHRREIEAMIEAHKTEIEELKEAHRSEISRLVEDYTRQIEDMREAHEREVNELTDSYENKITSLTDEYEGRISSLTEHYEDRLGSIEGEHQAEIDAIKAAHERDMDELTDRLTNLRNDCDERVAAAAFERDEAQRRANDIQMSFDKLTEEKMLADARIKALLYESGKLTENYTTRERFGQLEQEYKLFTRVYKEQWGKTKKQIRKNILNLKNFKGQSGQSDDLKNGDE